MTKATYRKKALPHLLTDFERRCAYCLDPNDFRSPSQDHVDHFDCKLRERKRHQYTNLMLSCSACNTCKHDKPLINPFDKQQRFLNCTEENEFPEHILETPDGQWVALTKEAEYHLECLGLTEACHRQKRFARRDIADQILKLCSTALQYQTENPKAVQAQIMETLRHLLETLKNFPPLVTDQGILSVSQWLKSKGVEPTHF